MTGKQYLGDGVYVEVENGMLKLTTEDGVNVSNIIYLENVVFQGLVRYYEKLTGATVEDGRD